MTQKRRAATGWGVWLVAVALVGVVAGAWAQKAPERGTPRTRTEAPEPLEVPRLDQDLEFANADVRAVLRQLLQNATPRYVPELDRAGLAGPVRVTLSFPAGTELEEAVRAVLTEVVRRHRIDLTYRFDTRFQRFALLPGALVPTRTFRTAPKDVAATPVEVRGTVRLPEIVLPASHTEDVNAIATTPDGKLVATSSDEDLVVLWEGGRLLRTFSGQISRRAFSHDGKTLYVFRDREVIPFDVATGQPGKPRPPFPGKVLAVSCSNDGKVLVSLDNKTVRLCQGPNLTDLRRPIPTDLYARYLIGASGRWAVGIPDGAEPVTAARLLDLTTGRLSTIPLTEPVSDADISPDDRLVAIGTDLARVVVARVEDRRPFLAAVCVGEKRDPLTEAGLTAPPANFSWTPASVAFGPGDRLAASAEGARIWVWNTRDATPPKVLSGHRMRYYNMGCRSLAFDKDGRLYSGSRGAVEDDEALLKFWDSRDGRLEGSLPGAGERLVPRVERIALSLDSQQIVASGKGGIQLWDLKLRRPPRRLMSGLPMAVSPDGFWMAARSIDPPTTSALPPAELRDAILGAFPGGSRDPRRIAEEARRLKTKVRGVTITHLGSGGGAQLEDPTRLTKALLPFAGAGGQCQAIVWYPHIDSNLVAVAGWDDKVVYLFDVADPKRPRRVFVGGHTMPVTELLFSPGGRFLVSRASGRDGKSEVCVWETATGKLRATPGRDLVRQEAPPLKEGEEAEPLAFLPGGSRTPWKEFPTSEIERIVLNSAPPEQGDVSEDYPQFLTVSALVRNPQGGEARRIYLYHLDTGLLMGTVDGRFPRFSDDSFWLMAVEEQGRNASALLAWDLTQGRRGEPPPPLRFPDTGEVLATRPGLLVCRAPNRRDIVLHFENGRARRTLTGHSAPVEAVLFDPRDGRIWSAARDGTIRLWSPTGEGIATLVLTGEGSDHLITLADQSYLATRGALRAVSFRVENRTYPFDQFDLYLNRPHVVLERLGATDLKLIERKRTAWQWRRDQAKLGERTLEDLLEEVPAIELEAEPLTTVPATQSTVRLAVKASDPKGRGLEKLRVLVNDVPVPLPESVELLQGSEARRIVDVPLVPGRNKIQVSVVNVGRVESLRIVRNIVWSTAPRNPVLYVVAVGISKYANGRNLRYAAGDAAEMAASLKRLETVGTPSRPAAPARRFGPARLGDADPSPTPIFGERYTKVVSLVLPPREATRKVFRERVEAFLKNARPEDHVVLYLTGHGLLDPASLEYRFCTVDWDDAALAETTVGMGEIDALLARCGARQKVILLDTCFSGKYFNPADYGVSGEDLEKVVGESFVDIAEGSGAQILAAASGSQTAQEGGKDASGKALRGGLFTAWLKDAFGRDPKRPGFWRADRGDDPRRLVADGRITVRELFRYVAAAASGNPGQRPALARESLEFDFPLLVGRAPAPPRAAPRRSRTTPRR